MKGYTIVEEHFAYLPIKITQSGELFWWKPFWEVYQTDWFGSELKVLTPRDFQTHNSVFYSYDPIPQRGAIK